MTPRLDAIRERVEAAGPGSYSAEFLRAVIDGDDAQVFDEATIALLSNALPDLRYLLAGRLDVTMHEPMALHMGDLRCRCGWVKDGGPESYFDHIEAKS
jgi:hypothetical protein